MKTFDSRRAKASKKALWA